WGGGLLVLTGLGYSLATKGTATIQDLLAFDPFNGYWFLSFGRNLVFPTEAFYHLLFFACILCVLRRRLRAATGLAFLTSLSHPWTGIELLLILTAWAGLEVFFLRKRELPRWFFGALVGLVGFHLSYYLFYMRS